MSRINKFREEALQPVRMRTCKTKLEDLGFAVESNDKNWLKFMYNGSKIVFWPYTGWASGASIKDGRGFDNLLKQLKDRND